MKNIIKHKITKRIAFSLAILFILPQIASSCLQFRMTTQEVDEYFKESKQQQPKIVKLSTEGRIINYAIQDNQKSVTAVFVHGAPGSWSAFVDFMKNDNLREHVNMISVDRPGYGFSDFGEPETSLENQAFFISEVLKEYPDQHFILIGHSLGGPVIARTAMDYPELVSGMVMVAPSIDPELEKEEWFRYLGKNRLVKWIIPTSFWVTNEEIWYLKGELKLMLPLWENIRSETIVIQGTEDNLVPKGNADFAVKMLDEDLVEVWMLEGVNHFIPWNNSQKITDAILKLKNNVSVGSEVSNTF